MPILAVHMRYFVRCRGIARLSPMLVVPRNHGMIRAALGEVFMLESVHPDNVSYPEIGISVLAGLFEEGRLSLAEWESLLKRAQLVLEEGFEFSPELAFAEDDWFATGMHDSPFAILNAMDPGNE